ncbi:MAG: hypothetical protein K6G15_10920 [Desulfovibrio sp.]|nr:hypothetical protein [Desulfovibrio sp.]
MALFSSEARSAATIDNFRIQPKPEIAQKRSSPTSHSSASLQDQTQTYGQSKAVPIFPEKRNSP